MMAMFSQPSTKRQKMAKDSMRMTETTEYFPGISKIEYKGPSAQYDDTLCYRYYNANERINGRTMEDWIRPAVSFTALKYIGKLQLRTSQEKQQIDTSRARLRQGLDAIEFSNDAHGKPTFQRNWNDNNFTVENYKRTISAAFEFCSKLGIKHWTATDSDLVSDADFYDEKSVHFEEICDFVQELQQKSFAKLLWIAADLQSNPRFASGAGTSYDANIMTQASHRIKKCLEMAQKLNAESFLVPSPQEGYNTVLNTDIQKELKHFARLLKMSSDYKDRSGFRGQLLLKPNESIHNDTMTPYIYDSISSVCFLKHYNLERQYKIVTDFGHQLYMSTVYNAVGSIELNINEKLNLQSAILLMKTIIENSGYQPGGINLKLETKRDSVDYKDVFIMYVHYVDTLAKALRISAKMLQDQTFTKNIQQRYSSYYSGFGSRLSNGEATLEECEDHFRKLQCQYNDNVASGRSEHWEATFENFVSSCKLN